MLAALLERGWGIDRRDGTTRMTWSSTGGPPMLGMFENEDTDRVIAAAFKAVVFDR